MPDMITLNSAKKYTDAVGSGISAINETPTGFELVTKSGTTLSFTIPYMLQTHTISTNGNYTLQVNSIYDIINLLVKDSILTLPTGTKTGQSIEVIVSVTGFDADNTFTIAGNINGVASNTITIRGSFVDYKFIWSETSQTWVSPHTVIN